MRAQNKVPLNIIELRADRSRYSRDKAAIQRIANEIINKKAAEQRKKNQQENIDPELKKLLTSYNKFVNSMTNRQRNRWSAKGYPGSKDKDVKAVRSAIRSRKKKA